MPAANGNKELGAQKTKLGIRQHYQAYYGRKAVGMLPRYGASVFEA